MSSLRYAFARIGSFMIDMSIIQMFTQIVAGLLFYRFIHLTYTNALIDISVIIFYMLLIIVMGLGYQYVCYHFLGNSLGKQLLRLRYYTLDGNRPDRATVMKREWTKYYVLYATFFTYGLFSLYQLFLSRKKKEPYHSRMTDTYVGRI